MSTQDKIRLWKEDMKLDRVLFRNSGQSFKLFNQFLRQMIELQTERLDWLENTVDMPHLQNARGVVKRQGLHTNQLLRALITS